MSIDAAKAIKDRLRTDLRTAMKERDAPAVRTLRTLIAALDNGEALPAPDRAAMPGDTMPTEAARRVLDAAAIAAIIGAEIAEREHAAAEFDALGRADRVAELRAEVELARRYLQ